MKEEQKTYWFKAKRYGWGWYPATWQGWIILALFVVLLVLNAYRIDSTSPSMPDMLISFVSQTVALMLILTFICYKTGEKPRWRWGRKDY